MKSNNLQWTVSAMVAFALLAPQASFAATEKQDRGVQSTTYYNVDDTGSNIMKNNAKVSKVTFQNVSLNATQTNIQGSVGGKASLPFQLTGSLTKAEDDKNMVVGHLKDNSGNFEVLHFSLDRSNTKDLMFDKKLGKSGDTVLRLYLLQKNTRDITVIEVVNPDFVSADNVFNERANYTVTEHSDEFWYGKLLKPIESKVDDLTHTGPEIYSAQRVVKDYVDTYVVAGSNISEHFVLNHNVNFPGSISTDGQNFTAQMYVSDEYTSNSSGSKISSDTYTKVGAYATTKLDTYLDKGDAYISMYWDGGYSTSGSVDTVYRWDMALPGTPIGFTTTYAGAQSSPNKTMKTFDNSGTYKYREAGVDYGQYKYLESVNQNFSASFMVGLFDASYRSSVKTWGTRWTYDISSTQNYSFGGIQTVSVYATYGD